MQSPHLPSLHPIGTSAAATCCTPLSVASILYCAAAFLVSCTSILIPNSLILRLVAGLNGKMLFPVPKNSRSGFGQARSSTPQTWSGTSNCPFAFCSFPPGLRTPLSSSPCPPDPIVPSFLPACIQGRHLKASPDSSITPAPVTLSPLFSAKPSSMHASTAVVGAGVLEKMSIELKSVCVSSLLAGPRSGLSAGLDGTRRDGEVCKHRCDRGAVARMFRDGFARPERAWWKQVRHRDARSLLGLAIVVAGRRGYLRRDRCGLERRCYSCDSFGMKEG